MDRYLSFWNVMAYDFQGSWSAATGHQAQLYGPPNEPSVDQAIQWYKSRGVRPDKLVVGASPRRRRSLPRRARDADHRRSRRCALPLAPS